MDQSVGTTEIHGPLQINGQMQIDGRMQIISGPMQTLTGEVARVRADPGHDERAHDPRLLAVQLARREARLRCFSHFGDFTRCGHIPGGGRPLLREGGPISYEARPSDCFRTIHGCSRYSSLAANPGCLEMNGFYLT